MLLHGRIATLIACFALTPTIHAQGLVYDIRAPRPPGTPQAQSNPRLLLESYRITGNCSERVARYQVTERFRNMTGTPVEGVFMFPVPRGTTARGIALIVNGNRMNGEILEAGKAADIYREIVRKMRDPALLEYVDDGLLRASVFPIPAQGTVDVEIDLETAVDSAGAGLLSLSLPFKQAAGTGAKVELDLTLAPSERDAKLTTIYSPTHAITIDREPNQPARVKYSGTVPEQKDFTLYFGADAQPGTIRILTHRSPGADGYFELLFEAPARTAGADAPESSLGAPRDVVFVLDRSGSMDGEKWQQAIRAMKFGIDTLREKDRFAVISFATDVRTFPATLAAASADQRAAAKGHLDSLRPAGGTAIGGALDSALALMQSEVGRLPLIVFVTDGLPTIGETHPDRLTESARSGNRSNARIFAFGVGYDVNTHLLDRIAEGSRGDSGYVAPTQDLEIPLSGFFAKVAEPELVSPALRVEGAEIYDVYPPLLPDLFSGSMLCVAGRIKGDGAPKFVLSGQRGGKTTTFERVVELHKSVSAADLPARHAGRKIGYLLDQVRLHGTTAELIDEITKLGREFGIVTPFTAGLVVEEGVALGRAAGVPVGALRDGLGREVAGDPRGGGGGPATPSAGPTTGGGGGLAPRNRPGDPTLSGATSFLTGARKKESGADAVAVANELKKQKSGELAGLDDATRAASANLTRRIGTRTLLKTGDTWIDASFTEAMRAAMKPVEAFSDEYFALLAKTPILKDVFALGSDLVIVIDGQAWHIVPPKES